MKKDYAEQYDGFEQSHWWFRARREILRQFIARHGGLQSGDPALEVGVGPGLNLYTLYPEKVQLQGLEPDPENARRAAARGSIPVFCGTVESMPRELTEQKFQLITMFDVLEHIQDDRKALRVLRAMLRPGGQLMLSVPAYNWMWGQQDVVNLHFRRYTRGSLVRLLQEEGFAVSHATYFNTFLFPPIALFRLLARIRPKSEPHAQTDFNYSAGFADAWMYRVFLAEKYLLKILRFPFGVSVLAVASPVRTAQD